MTAERPQKLVFVGGAPRSGTTVTHALICTSARVSDYHPEISFFRGLAQAYRNGRGAWKQHTSAFFADPEDFRRHMRTTADLSLDRIWRAQGSAEILCMKDPLLTPFFPDLKLLYPTEAWFVVVIRHPYDIVRSRQEVHAKSGEARPFGPGDAAMVAREYMSFYQQILAQGFGGRLFMFKYEDLNSQQIQMGLAQFVGVDDLDATRMWGEAPPDMSADAWGSPKYNQAIDLAPRLDALTPELTQVTRTICGQMMERFGYDG